MGQKADSNDYYYYYYYYYDNMFGLALGLNLDFVMKCLILDLSMVSCLILDFVIDP